MRATPWRSVLLAVLVLTAGCASVEDVSIPTSDPDFDLESPDSATGITVVEVVDGDTVTVEYANGSRDTARLLGVDTPEVHVENTPGEFEGVPTTEAGRSCLRDWGHRASEFARTRLLGERVNLSFDPNEPRRGAYGRLLVYVHHDGGLFNYRLVSQGYARVYDSQFVERERFYAAEDRARSNAAGLWHCRTPDSVTGDSRDGDGSDATDDGGRDGSATGDAANATDGSLAVVQIHADAPGNDNDNLNDEYVVFENTEDDPLDLSGWTVGDEAGHVYAFPDGFVLEPGATVTLYTGSGTDSASGVYWGADGAIWNNGGDTVIVTSDGGETVARVSYSG